jgi:hypothetical protein
MKSHHSRSLGKGVFGEYRHFLSKNMLRGPRSFDSTVGTKPTLEAQLDSSVFYECNGSPYLSIWTIYRWDLLVIERVSFCESSSFRLNDSLFFFSIIR